VSEWARALEKGSGARVVAEKRAVVGASTTESASGRLGKGAMADRRGPQTSEGERANGRSALTVRSHRAASESRRVRGRVGADSSTPPGYEREGGEHEGEG
jgi:hypothetical protein